MVELLRLPSPDGIRVTVRCTDSVFGSVLPLVSENTLRPDFSADEETGVRVSLAPLTCESVKTLSY